MGTKQGQETKETKQGQEANWKETKDREEIQEAKKGYLLRETIPWNMEIQIPQNLLQIHHQKQKDHNQQATNEIETKHKLTIPWMVHSCVPHHQILHQIHNQRYQDCDTQGQKDYHQQGR